jgi:outer membrane lipoprotein-sorting protein
VLTGFKHPLRSLCPSGTRRTATTLKRLCLPALALPVLSLTGCLSHTRIVKTVQAPPVVMNATPADLVKKLNTQFDSIQSMTAIVDIVASVGGGATGKVTEYHPFHGYIIVEKPSRLRVILVVPVLGKGMDMVSDGQTFKMVIPIQDQALIGKDAVIKPSAKPLENLRPNVFYNAMLIPGVRPGEIVSVIESSRMLDTETRKHQVVEEPDYDLTMLHMLSGDLAETTRVVHFNRVTLEPYKQDIFDEHGKLQTTATYDRWLPFTTAGPDGKPSQIIFPTRINIERPVDQYSLRITVTKLTANQKLEPDQFELCIPAGYKVRDMDDPQAPPITAPPATCGTQSPH